MADLHKGKGFTQQTAPTRAVELRPFRESITQTFIQNSSWQSPSLLIRSPLALLETEKARPKSALALRGRCPPQCPEHQLCGAPGSCGLTCCSREPGAAAAPAALRSLPCSHRPALLPEVLRALPSHQHCPLRTLAESAHSAVLLPRPARKGQVVFLMATSS